jgi:hypothetical protein
MSSELETRVRRATSGAIDQAVAAYVAERAGKALPALFWHQRDDGSLHGHAPRMTYVAEQVPTVLAPWVELFGLEPETDRGRGTLAYTGTVDGTAVRVWGVVDPERYDRRMAELLAPYREGGAR